MNELAYVLTVEAAVFGALCTVLVAQRVDVFEWPADHTWPVFAGSVQFVLWYAQLLLFVCCFVAAGRFAVVAPEVLDALARSVGRLSTVAALSVCALYALLWERGAPARASCMLCQLWGSSCSHPDALLWSWSYPVYWAVLLPSWATQIGLQVAAAGMCKQTRRLAPRRLITANCVFVLLLHVNYTLGQNAVLLGVHSCTPPAAAGSAKASKIVHSQHVIGLAMVLCTLDMAADFKVGMSAKHHTQPSGFVIIRVLQLVCYAMYNMLYEEEALSWSLFAAVFGLASLLGVMDMIDAYTTCAAMRSKRRLEDETRPDEVAVPVLKQAAQVVKRGAFEVEPARRRKFMLSFLTKTRWPTAALREGGHADPTLETIKKTT